MNCISVNEWFEECEYLEAINESILTTRLIGYKTVQKLETGRTLVIHQVLMQIQLHCCICNVHCLRYA